MKPALLLACAVALAAQEPHFDARSRLVLVPVTVMNAQGQVIDALEATDFIVLDNGRPQKAAVDTIATGVAPIALVIAVQSSGISAAVLQKVQKVGNTIQPLITGDRGCVALVSFAERVRWLQECTKDPDALGHALHQLRPGDAKRGRMLDAVSAAIERLSKIPDARRILLLISESRDRGSEAELAAVTAAAQAADVVVYAATYSAFRTAFTSKAEVDTPLQNPVAPVPNVTGTVDGLPPMVPDPKLIPPNQSVDILAGIGELERLHQTDTTQVLTTQTGGARFSFTRQKGLENAIEKLGAELHAQYVISFSPDAATAGYHRLTVRMAHGGEFVIRARPGYWYAGELPR